MTPDPADHLHPGDLGMNSTNAYIVVIPTPYGSCRPPFLSVWVSVSLFVCLFVCVCVCVFVRLCVRVRVCGFFAQSLYECGDAGTVGGLGKSWALGKSRDAGKCTDPEKVGRQGTLQSLRTLHPSTK